MEKVTGNKRSQYLWGRARSLLRRDVLELSILEAINDAECDQPLCDDEVMAHFLHVQVYGTCNELPHCEL
jgi:hypothetical protein